MVFPKKGQNFSLELIEKMAYFCTENTVISVGLGPVFERFMVNSTKGEKTLRLFFIILH